MSVRLERLAAPDPLSSADLEQELQHRYFVWDGWVGGRRRVDVHPVVLSPAAHREAVAVAEAAAALVGRAADRAAADPDERARYRLHPDVEALARAARDGGDRGTLVRVDLLVREDGRFVACEVNADCPGGANETLALPRLARAAGFRRGHDPTDVAGRLADRLVAMSGGRGSPRGAVGLVFATGYAEDLAVCALVERLVVERGGRAVRVPATALRADGDGVAFRGERVGVLYRFYPLEYMEGQRNVPALAAATARGALASMSTFAAIHAQSKLAMARAWAAEPIAARDVFPETFALAEVGAARAARERQGWVLKRALSRVGDHVVVGPATPERDFAAALDEIGEAEADGDVWIAQRFVPQRVFGTAWGPRQLTLGVYLLDGVFAGYFARLSDHACCTHDALVLPVFVGEEELAA